MASSTTMVRQLHATLLVLLVACSSEHGSHPQVDAPAGGDAAPTDAHAIDAPAEVTVTLTQTTSIAVTPGRAVSCTVGSTKVTQANTFYRVFPLADAGIPDVFRVTRVAFAVEEATGPSGATTQPATLAVGTYSGSPGATSLALADITPLASVSIEIPNGSDMLITTPISAVVPGGSNVIVSLAIPDGNPTGTIFAPGMNGSGESKPGYLLGTACGITPPSSINAIGAMVGLPEADLVLTVTGSH